MSEAGLVSTILKLKGRLLEGGKQEIYKTFIERRTGKHSQSDENTNPKDSLPRENPIPEQVHLN